MKKLVLLGVLCALGLGSAVAIAAVTGEVSACATVTGASHTVLVDGAPVATVGGDTATKCVTTTYTVPDPSTVTVTTGGTTTATTTATTPTTTTTPAPAATPVPVGQSLFSDEFNGAAGTLPSSTLWGAKTSHAGSGLAYWNGWNQVKEDGSGNLVITAVDNGGTWDSAFLSGKIAYGGPRYVEARAKVPCGYGTWSAPAWEWDAPYGAGGLEVDESEQLGRSPTANNVHVHNWTVSPQKSAGGSVAASSALCNGFHTYGAAVYSDHIDFYLDGVKDDTLQASAIGLSSLTASSLQEVANIDLNMGGSWAGTPTMSGPVTMLVDYLHIYRI